MYILYIYHSGGILVEKVFIKTGYSSKIFMSFIFFSCVTFFAKTVLIPSIHILLQYSVYEKFFVKGPFSSLRQFLTTESSLKMMKKTFYFMLKNFCSLRCLYFVLIFWLCRKTM